MLFHAVGLDNGQRVLHLGEEEADLLLGRLRAPAAVDLVNDYPVRREPGPQADQNEWNKRTARYNTIVTGSGNSEQENREQLETKLQ